MDMAKMNFTFMRVEKKYLLEEVEYKSFLKMIEPYMTQDKYGVHTICNIYYDTDAFDLIRSSIEKPRYKEKLRLRSYGIPNDGDTVFLEIKKKFKGTVFKRRISMTLKEASEYLEYGVMPSERSQILSEIDYFINFYKPTPKLYLAYDRTAYFGKEDCSVRITFDKNIRSRDDDLDLKSGDYGEYLLSPEQYLMEIKVSDALPLWLVHILSELKAYPISFSKYGNIYKQDLAEKWRVMQCSQAY